MAFIQTESGLVLPSSLTDGCSYSIATAVDGARNAKNDFVGSVVGSDKLKIENTLELSPEEMQILLSVFDRDRGGHFIQRFRIYDPRISGFTFKTMYVGDRTGTPVVLGDTPTHWKNVKFSLVER